MNKVTLIELPSHVLLWHNATMCSHSRLRFGVRAISETQGLSNQSSMPYVRFDSSFRIQEKGCGVGSRPPTQTVLTARIGPIPRKETAVTDPPRPKSTDTNGVNVNRTRYPAP